MGNSSGASFEETYEIDRTIPTEFLYPGVEKPGMIQVKSIRFFHMKRSRTASSAELHAKLKLELLSGPKREWFIHVSLLDASDVSLRSAFSIVKNNGIVEGVPFRYEEVVDLNFRHDVDVEKVQRCQVYVEEIPCAEKAIEPSWGEARKGVRLGAAAAASPQKSTGRVWIRYYLENNSKESMRFYGGPSSALISRVLWSGGRISVIGPEGVEIPCRRAVPFPSEGIDVKSGETYESVIDLSWYFDFENPGEYQVTLSLRVHPSDDPEGNKGFLLGSRTFSLLLEGEKTVPDSHIRKKPIFEEKFELDREIPVKLGWGTYEQPEMLTFKSIRFEKRELYDGSFVIILLAAKIKYTVCSWPKTSWKLEVKLMDEKGGNLGYGQIVFYNSGFALGRPLWSDEELELNIRQEKELSDIPRFQISVSEAEEPQLEKSPQSDIP
jgi:hypothetical protein